MSPALRGYRALRDALLEKTGKSAPWLSRQVAKRSRVVPLGVKVGQAVVAHDNGIRVEHYLSGADLAEVQQAIRDVRRSQVANGPVTTNSANKHRGGTGPNPLSKTRSISFKGAGLDTSDPFLPQEKIQEAREMEAVYPVLYVLENSIREVIHRVMTGRFGERWWDTQITGGKLNGVRDRVAGRLKTEDKNSWHQRRGSRPIDYTDFEDLLTMAQAKPDLFFPRLLGEVEWFRQFFKELLPSRNVVCHMNPLSKTNNADVALRLRRWEEHLKNRRSELEEAMKPERAAAASPS